MRGNVFGFRWLKKWNYSDSKITFVKILGNQSDVNEVADLLNKGLLKQIFSWERLKIFRTALYKNICESFVRFTVASQVAASFNHLVNKLFCQASWMSLYYAIVFSNFTFRLFETFV